MRLLADELDLMEIVKQHDAQWNQFDSIQLFYSRSYKSSIVERFFPDCYWESEGGKVRSVAFQHNSFSTDKNGKPVIVDMCEDLFYNGKDSYRLVVPQDKYPLTEFRLCDYVSSRDEGYSASIVPGNVFDARLTCPLPKLFSVHTEKRGLTLLELVNKYPSKIVSYTKNTFGDSLVEIAVEDNTDKHETFGPWKLQIFINVDKGYNIDSYQRFSTAKGQTAVKMISDCVVKKYVEVREKCWIPCNIEFIAHNGNPVVGIRTNVVVDRCRINDITNSRINDFCFPENFVVNESVPSRRTRKIHIWGHDNKPARSFDEVLKFTEYYSNECMTGEMPKENRYFVLRISMMILGLIMIIFALYRLYAKER